MFGLVLEHPWWLLLLIPFVIGIATRIPGTYFSKAHSHIAPVSLGGARVRRLWQKFALVLPKWIQALVLIFIVAALVDITKGYTVVVSQKMAQRFIVSVDVSSSMYGFLTSFPTITCKQNSGFFQRIKGACRALYRLVDEVERETRDEKDLRIQLALFQFAWRSAIVSYPTSDYRRYRAKIDELEFKEHNLGASTGMHIVLWDMFLMALGRNMKQDGGFTYLSAKDMQMIYLALAPGPKDSPLHFPRDLAEKLAKVRPEMRDTLFILPTDAVVSFLAQRMDSVHPSIRRVMQLAEFLEIPVYFLSTDEEYPELKRLARRTGFELPEGSYRGDFLMVRREKDEYLVEELVGKLLKSRFGLSVPTYEERRESYADLFLELALTILMFGVLWRKLVARSLTEQE
ncbi:MAG: hypothetical protein HY471_02825 [Candidatus Sungbacteria bacterium]|nr:hypothetical protein [Candidatus Sungbacteria bacterium]